MRNFPFIQILRCLNLNFQVTGELSNYGQPMRRFMQTFVLAPQSPKKYYVHNDIFRYQDEVFPDSESDVENFESGGMLAFFFLSVVLKLGVLFLFIANIF